MKTCNVWSAHTATPRPFAHCFAMLLLAVACVPSGNLRAETRAQEAASLATMDWAAFVRDHLAAPDAPEFATEMDKAKYVFDLVGNHLAALNVPPNTDLPGRMQALGGKGDAIIGNCGYCSKVLFHAFLGAGFEDSRVFQIAGYKEGVLTKLPERVGAAVDPNLSHAGVGIVVNGQVWMFDLWAHGRDTSSFANAQRSAWRAILFQDWVSSLREYVTFTWDNGTLRSQSRTGKADNAVEAQKQIVRDARSGRTFVNRTLADKDRLAARDHEITNSVAYFRKMSQRPMVDHWQLQEIRPGSSEEGYPPEFSKYWSGAHGSIDCHTDPIQWDDSAGVSRHTTVQYAYRWSIKPLAYLRPGEKLYVNGWIRMKFTGSTAPKESLAPSAKGHASFNGHSLFEPVGGETVVQKLWLDEYGSAEAKEFAFVPTGEKDQTMQLLVTLGGEPAGMGMVVYTWKWVIHGPMTPR